MPRAQRCLCVCKTRVLDHQDGNWASYWHGIEFCLYYWLKIVLFNVPKSETVKEKELIVAFYLLVFCLYCKFKSYLVLCFKNKLLLLRLLHWTLYLNRPRSWRGELSFPIARQHLQMPTFVQIESVRTSIFCTEVDYHHLLDKVLCALVLANFMFPKVCLPVGINIGNVRYRRLYLADK